MITSPRMVFIPASCLRFLLKTAGFSEDYAPISSPESHVRCVCPLGSQLRRHDHFHRAIATIHEGIHRLVNLVDRKHVSDQVPGIDLSHRQELDHLL